MSNNSGTRRDFLKPGTSSAEPANTASSGAAATVHVGTRAMACDFAVIMNPGPHEQVTSVGGALELIADVETRLSIYQPHSELSRVNREAQTDAVRVEPRLFDLLQTARQLCKQTQGAFDIAAGAQIKLWRQCRAEHRVPTDEEIADVLEQSGSHRLELDETASTVRFTRAGLTLDPGAIGKGLALDEADAWLRSRKNAPTDFLVHGGHSSLIARGHHQGQDGWPVGIGNPLLTKKRLATVRLRDQAMSTSGSNIQFFRHAGRRYGHILDPRNARPVAGMLSVTVFADSAAVADALSTAFFVLGVENARACCDNLPGVSAILVPFPESGAKVTPTVLGVPGDQVLWDQEQVSLQHPGGG